MNIIKLLAALFFLQIILFSQIKNVKVNINNYQPEEVSIAINPLNPKNLVAGANININFWSTDGGETWKEGYITSKEYGVWGDPCLVFDLNGQAYFFHLSRPSQSQWIDRMVCQKSTDGGATYSAPGTYTGLNLPKKQDKEWACVDYTTSPGRNNIYLTWTQFDAYESRLPQDRSNIMFSFSSDGGLNWSPAKMINEVPGDCMDNDSTVEGAVPAVSPNGDIYVAWSGPIGIVFDRSTDFGKTWLDKDISVCEQVKGWAYDIDGIYRCNGLPITCCDISNSPYKGNIYINYTDATNGENDMDVFIVRSTDAGDSWSAPIRVNQDPVGNKKQQFMSWMHVDPVTGAVNVVYYDRRNYDSTQTDVFIARSTDGGETFNEFQISEKPFVPDKSIFFGDYINVNSYNNFTACIWQRMDKKTLSVWYWGKEF